jgi:hypothetical protein
MTITFQPTGDNFYRLKYGTESNPSNFEAVFVKINGQLFLDLAGSLPDRLGDGEYRNAFIPAHTIYKVKIIKDSLYLYETDYSWFNHYRLNNNDSLRYEWIPKAMLLTLPTGDLADFITAHSHEPGMFKDSIVAVSADAGRIRKQAMRKEKAAADYNGNILQSCPPAFPLKDGWLGGDGDVSVPVNPTTTLYLFSDTYVGNKGQHSRKEPGIKMVSNTVGVYTCLTDGSTSIKYFWGDMYTENPAPIFKSFTRRYIYWVITAFMIRGNLYAVLQKVGPKLGAPPNDIFSFSLLGFTLAKIRNPVDKPNEWNIEYIPLPDFSNPSMAIGPHVRLDNYLYFLISREDKAQALVRKHYDFIDDPGKPFEYYALDKTWKAGLPASDLDSIVKGFRSNTVNYHPDLDLWVMVCDPNFMDNKINIRTAKRLTGPWSDEIPVYEMPEITPGNPSYHKSNFCYLARECIQNYDPKRKEMLITYDINNSDFSEIISNPGVYTPKVLKVSLKKLLNAHF